MRRNGRNIGHFTLCNLSPYQIRIGHRSEKHNVPWAFLFFHPFAFLFPGYSESETERKAVWTREGIFQEGLGIDGTPGELKPGGILSLQHLKQKIREEAQKQRGHFYL